MKLISGISSMGLLVLLVYFANVHDPQLSLPLYLLLSTLTIIWSCAWIVYQVRDEMITWLLAWDAKRNPPKTVYGLTPHQQTEVKQLMKRQNKVLAEILKPEVNPNSVLGIGPKYTPTEDDSDE